MPRSRADDRTLKRAVAASVALHCLLLPLIVVSSSAYESSVPATTGTSANESTAVAYLTISHRARTRPVHAVVANSTAPSPFNTLTVRHDRAAARTAIRTAARTERPRHANVRAATSATGTRWTADGGARTSSGAIRRAQPRIAITLATPAPEREPVSATANAIVTTVPVIASERIASPERTALPADAAPVAAARVASSGVEVPPGGWGQTFDKPLVADDNALAELRAKFHGARAVTIDVDEAGHATRVTLASGLPDDVRADLERNLLALRYVPAECNGLRCTGKLLLSL